MKKLLGLLGLVGWVATASCGGLSRAGEHGGAARVGATNAAGHGGSGGWAGAAPSASRGGSGANDGGSGLVASPCSVEPTELDGLSFEVELDDDLEDRLYVFHFVSAPAGLEVVIGSDGYAVRTWLGVRGDKLVIGEPKIADRSDDGFSGNGTFIYNLELCVEPPRDSSGRLRGKGALLVVASSYGYLDEWEKPVDFDASVDTRPPSLPDAVKLSPLEPALIPLSEPVALGAAAAISGSSPASLDAVVMVGTVVGFKAPGVLPFGLDSAVTATAQDLIGLRLESNLRVSTEADPGVQAQDGFESELHALDYGYPAELVHGAQVLDGSASLYLPPGADTVLHLTRSSPGAKTLRFDFLPDPFVLHVWTNIVVRAGVISGTRIQSLTIPVSSNDWHFDGAGGGAGSAATAPIAVQLELSEPGDDIVVSISTPYVEESESGLVGAVIDRLRIE